VALNKEIAKRQNPFTGLIDQKDGAHFSTNGELVNGANAMTQKESNDDPKAAKAAEEEETMEEKEKKGKELAAAAKEEADKKKEDNKLKPHSFTGNLHGLDGKIYHTDNSGEIGGANHWIARKMRKHHLHKRHHLHQEPKG